MIIDSKLYSLSEIVEECPEWHFNIPIYQRLYVWGEDQVLTLLNDLINAFEREADIFFLGGTLLVEQENGSGRLFDLIDGQQRFTTLWMLCQAWKKSLVPFLTVTNGKTTKPRLRFAIRPTVDRFLEKLAFSKKEESVPVEEATKRMDVALQLMESVFEKRALPAGVTDKEKHLKELTDFVFNKVKYVITTVPRETDLNKLFEVINNRGVQLQHHEILKARMLDALHKDEREPYAVLWDACANMDNFVERNLGGHLEGIARKATELYENGKLADASAVREMIVTETSASDESLTMPLEEILTGRVELDNTASNAENDNPEPTWVRSIFGFPLFLQHALRIWLFENRRDDVPRLLDRELLELFETHFLNDDTQRANNARTFIDLLWRLRVLFDEHIIKWVDQGEEEIHLISRISISESNGKRYMSRSRESDSHREFSLLQSMLYHSQEITTQYWLSPLLLFIHRNPSKVPTPYFDYLRHLDNHLLSSVADESLVKRTRRFMEEPWLKQPLIYKDELNKNSGTKFAHYWFYKLEFVLWFLRRNTDDRWKKFRLTAKSSIEHISPQTPTGRDDNRVIKELDCFGNLALVSRSINSEYGNLPFNEKQQRFENNNKVRVDSLKMDLIYKNELWNDEWALKHQEEMIETITKYVEDTPCGVVGNAVTPEA